MKSKIARPAAVRHCVNYSSPVVNTGRPSLYLNRRSRLLSEWHPVTVSSISQSEPSEITSNQAVFPASWRLTGSHSNDEGWLSRASAHAHSRQAWFALWWNLGFSCSVYWNNYWLIILVKSWFIQFFSKNKNIQEKYTRAWRRSDQGVSGCFLWCWGKQGEGEGNQFHSSLRLKSCPVVSSALCWMIHLIPTRSPCTACVTWNDEALDSDGDRICCFPARVQVNAQSWMLGKATEVRQE